ncbi:MULTISPECIES: cation transporter [Aliivibrio]|uniref:Cation transporter n=1 Tax=Aliivibrio finisterrensis TaxID=511998 RepID=A0A4Q5L2U9_9GAMM|nr:MULTISPECIES: cation transporter [Aliivibrio]MDD9180045.1 cation transporter [Aliivibrio sp. A6]RYU52402.1 cation transporter [Aliivibrio finisterrensis]RYU55004.1 cation transporter [Aliivibrio finisterrensis]RYU58038.1 cation transporter [Aliivibrio finisterrensis]RYU66630.1 cation transporter [Aliivibrio finisterrensis]
MSYSIHKERQLLLISTFSALLFAMIGITLGSLIHSLVIIFDGVYSLVSLGLTLVSLAAVMYIRKEEVAKNIKRVKVIEFSVILLKGIAITLMCVLSFISAVEAIMDGGREVNTGIALAFGVFSMIGCYTSYWVMKTQGRAVNSALIEAEAKQWLMDTVISAAVFIGFMVAKLLLLTSHAHYAELADPVMVVLASIYFIIVPVKMIISSSKQLHQLNRDGVLAKYSHA